MAFLNSNGLSHFWNTIKTYLKERYQDKHERISVKLPASAWSSNAMTVDAAGVTATNDIVVGARPDCNTAWADAGVYCSAQSNGVVSFSCKKTPTADLYANILILNDADEAEDEPESTTPVTFDMIYPIGSVYMSVNNVDPAVLFGMGTWERIQDTFLLAAGSTYAAGSTGGEATHTLTEAELPKVALNVAITDQATAAQSTYRDAVSSNIWTNVWRDSDWVTQASVTDSAFGGGAAHNNMPPYFAVYMWKRTA